ncbi:MULTISPECIES: GatB/YqeY domain-containing protein [Mogibacterium]|uniref:YqeY-like protein n=1 Tax=Mogibacterium timidum ATCC 33093 TaxID=1401079 RepID=X8IRD5_9FIRM|nr:MULTISPECIES: GatB/YqeY domain-containing protein [Mogibacterium]EJU19372.1 YqeY-like protein [Mogibacterium sp. CM50]EUC52212.1 YqeY-like protein [Mogibacterium timidum ATCC 33093]
MGLKEQLMSDYKTAMKEHDVTTKETVNLVRAAIKQHEVDQKVVLEDDADIIPIIKKQLKMRRDALADFERAGRTDLLDGYNKEIEVLERYLPEELSEEAVLAAIEKIADEEGIERNMKSMGVMMKTVMSKLRGQADGSLISKMVREYLSK